MEDTLVIDLETKKSFADVGGEANIRDLGISVAGVYSYNANKFFALEEHEVPQLEEMQKEESGKQKINMWTRWATVPLAIMQSYGMITLLRRSQYNILGDISGIDLFSMIITITAA